MSNIDQLTEQQVERIRENAQTLLSEDWVDVDDLLVYVEHKTNGELTNCFVFTEDEYRVSEQSKDQDLFTFRFLFQDIFSPEKIQSLLNSQ